MQKVNINKIDNELCTMYYIYGKVSSFDTLREFCDNIVKESNLKYLDNSVNSFNGHKSIILHLGK